MEELVSPLSRNTLSFEIDPNHRITSGDDLTDLKKSPETKITIADDTKADGKRNLENGAEETDGAVQEYESQMLHGKEVMPEIIEGDNVYSNGCPSAGLSPHGDNTLQKEQMKKFAIEIARPPSMFLQPVDSMKYAWKNSKGRMEFFLRAVAITLASSCWFFCIGGVPVLPITLIVAGGVFLEDCTAAPVPLFLIVIGAINILEHITAMWNRCLPDDEKKFVYQRIIARCMYRVLLVILFVVILRASVYVYAVYEPNYIDKKDWNYCNKTFYLFSFWMCNLFYSLFCVFLIFVMYLLCCASSSTEKRIAKFFMTGKGY